MLFDSLLPSFCSGPHSHQAYYGGEAHCAEAVSVSDEYNAAELVCPSCSNVGGAVQVMAWRRDL